MNINDIERKSIRENATEYLQIKRGFAASMNDIIQEGNADLYNYFSQNERMYVILSYICRLRVLNENYKSVVKKFMNTLPYDSFEGMLSRCEIFIILLSNLNQNMKYNGCVAELDREAVVEAVCEWIKDDVEGFVESYLEPSELEYEPHEENYDYGIMGGGDGCFRLHF